MKNRNSGNARHRGMTRRPADMVMVVPAGDGNHVFSKRRITWITIMDF